MLQGVRGDRAVWARWLFCCGVLGVMGCPARPGPAQPDPGVVTVLEDHTRATGLYAAPFPSDGLVQADGHILMDGFPNPYNADLPAAGVQLLGRDARGFARTGAVFFQLSAPLDPAGIPTLAGTLAPDAQIILTPVSSDAPGAGARHILEVAFHQDGGPHGSRNMLGMLPVQGMPLAEGTTYVAAVLRGLKDAAGRPLRASSTVAALQRGEAVPGLPASTAAAFSDGVAALGRMGIQPGEIAGLTVFTTDTPVARMVSAREDALALGTPVLTRPFQLTDVFPDYCVWEAHVALPVFQQGTPPYTNAGGAWAVDAAGHLVQQRMEDARVWFTVPRRPAPAAGWPLVMMVRTGGGADRAWMDRGVRDASGMAQPGTGPAQRAAQAGFAGISWDGPLGGIRNPTGGDEQFLVFNVFNPNALRDNVRQSALEAVLLANAVDTWLVNPAGCDGATPAPGASQVGWDLSRMALLGHSMGASIAPLAVAVEPRFSALLLSGAGGSWVENVMHKVKPLAVRPAFEILLSYTDENRQLVPTDPILTLFQWAAEDADAQVYAPHIITAPRHRTGPAHVLMIQGIVDHYILPNIANALSVPLGLDLVAPALDASHPELAGQRPLEEMAAWAGRTTVTAPVSGNRTSQGTTVTAVVVQLPQDPVEDGHEVFFQRQDAHDLFRCFLRSWDGQPPTLGTCPP